MTKIIGVAGISGSGKTELCRRLAEKLSFVTLISQDSFYRGVPEDVDVEYYNFDDVGAFDLEELEEILDLCVDNDVDEIDVPEYDFSLHKRSGRGSVQKKEVILVEGHMIFGFPEVRSRIDALIFIDLEFDLALVRRLGRDVEKRGRVMNEILDRYLRYVRKANISTSQLKFDADYVVYNGVFSESLDQIVRAVELVKGSCSS